QESILAQFSVSLGSSSYMRACRVRPGRVAQLHEVVDRQAHTYFVSPSPTSPAILWTEYTLMNAPGSVLMIVCLAGPRTTRSKWKVVPSSSSLWTVPVQSLFTV